MFKQGRKAQSLGEYAILISLVVAIMMALFPLVKRGTQSFIRAGADEIGNQEDADQDFNSDTGFTNASGQATNSDSYTIRRDWPGMTGLYTNTTDTTVSNTYSNLGFTNQEG